MNRISRSKLPRLTLLKLQFLARLTRYEHFANGWSPRRRSLTAYQHFDQKGLVLNGQRDTHARVQSIRQIVDLSERRVLDIGCSLGGLLFNADEMAFGYGIDGSAMSVRFAREFSVALGRQSFIADGKFQFERIDFNSADILLRIEALIVEQKIDLVFCLSILSWMPKFGDLIDLLGSMGIQVLVESNNDIEWQEFLATLDSSRFNLKSNSTYELDDVTGNVGRRLHLLSPQR